MVKKREREAASEYAPRMGRSTFRNFAICLLRNAEVFREASAQLKPDDLRDIDLGVAVAYRVALDFHAAYSALPDKATLWAGVEEALADDSDFLTSTEIESLQDLVDDAFNPDTFDGDVTAKDSYYEKYGIDQLRRLLKEQLADEIAEKVATDAVPSALPAMLSGLLAKSESIDSITHFHDDVPFPDGWDVRVGIDVTTTGLSFFDTYLNGGTAPSEAYVLLAPYGSCKTTIAVMGVVEAARAAYRKTLDPGWDGKRGVAFLVSYESPVDELRMRALSYAARIERSSIEAMKSIGDLNGPEEGLKPYEKTLFSALLARKMPVLTERERATAELGLFNNHLRFLEFTGSDARRGLGAGYVDEIAREISVVCRRLNAYPALVWIDYAGFAVNNYIAAGHADQADRRELLKDFPGRARRQIGAQFGCPVWVNHQLAAAANGWPAWKPMHHTDSEGSKGIGENADFCFCIGNRTTTDPKDLVVVNCTKHRRYKPLSPRVLRIEGHLNRVVDTDDAYEIDLGTREIVARADRDRVVGVAGLKTAGRRVTDDDWG